MTRAWTWLLRRGWPWAMCAAAAIGAALVFGLLVPQWQADTDLARQQLQRDRTALADVDRQRREAATTPRQDVASWPAASRGSERVADLLEGAVRSGVTVPRSQQRVDAGGPGGVQVLRLTQSASGSYPDLRRWIGHALQSDPALALERLRLQRGSPVAAEFQAEVHWVLLQRADGAAR